MARDLLSLWWERVQTMIVNDVMSRAVQRVAPDASVQSVAEVMREERIGAVVIVDEGGVAGIVTDRDLVTRVLAPGLPASTRVASVMSADPITCAPEHDVGEALRIMRIHQIRRTPVVSDGRLIGIISLSDIAFKTTERDDVEMTLADLCERTSSREPEPGDDEHREVEARHI